jgi:hypothetical protein
VALSRRKIFKRAVGAAVIGAAGGSLLTEAISSPAPAADGVVLTAQDTTVEQGAVAPTVVTLTDAATIEVDASLGNDFRVTIAGNRAMGNPSNSVDGQKIVFQVTQDAGGPFTITWGSSYEFSTGLPRPSLSTRAGHTDVLEFVYNNATGNWLLATFVNGFSVPTVSPPNIYRLFPSTNGPANANSYHGNWLAGVSFEVTNSGMWFEGYWWWVCNSGQQTDAQKFALWQVNSDSTGILIPGSAVTSGTLSVGQWNYVPLSAPIQLSINTGYMAATGYLSTSGFPITQDQFGSGQPYGSGITNGPLFAYSSPGIDSILQGAYSQTSADPTAAMPNQGVNNSNFWMDVQVSDTAPAGYAGSYRIWPNQPDPYDWQYDTPTNNWTLGTEFLLSQACTLDNIWFYSPPGTSQLPTECGIWNVVDKTIVSGTDNASPSWSGAAGSGWVSCSYSGVALPPGDYKVTVFNGASSVVTWSATSFPYWSSPGFGANGITNGPLSVPNDADATSPGQSTYQQATSFTYPYTYAPRIGSATYWVDVEVTPTS